MIPSKLQESVNTAAHRMGHLGINKTKKMLRGQYWFPLMDQMVEEKVKSCYLCQLTTKEQRPKPIKLSTIPDKP